MSKPNEKKTPAAKSNQVADKIKSIDGQPIDNKHYKAKFCFIPNTNEAKEENHKESTSKNETGIDAILKLLNGHIHKYNEDSKKAEEKMTILEENTKEIKKNTERIDRNSTAIEEIMNRNKEMNEENVKNKEEIVVLKNNEKEQMNRMNNLEELTKQNREKIDKKNEEDEIIINNKLKSIEDNLKKKFDDEISRPADDIFTETETYKKLIDRISELERRSNSIPTTRNPLERSQNHDEFPALFSKQPTSHQEAQAVKGYRQTYANQAKETGAKPKITGRYVEVNQSKPKSDNQVVDDTFNEKKIEELFYESAGKVVFFPVSREDITKWSWRSENKNHEVDTDNKVFYSPEYKEERYDQAMDICISKYRFYESEVTIKDVQYCNKASAKMLIVTTTKEFAKALFIRAATLQDRSINVIQHIPGPALTRKKALDKLLTSIRKKTPGLRTQVRLGKSDLKVMAKVQKKNDYSPYEEIPMSEVDPMNTLPEINIPGYKKPPNTSAIANLIRNFERELKTDKVDEDGYSTVERKRKGSPGKEDYRKKQKENTPEKLGERFVSRLEGRTSREEPEISIVEEIPGAASLITSQPDAAKHIPDTQIQHKTPPKVSKPSMPPTL